MNFEWDTLKADENLRKHKVRFSEATETFSDSDGFALADVKHSQSEKRYYWIGKTSNGRVLTTRYTKRAETIRIIGSAEWREFRELYNEKTKSKKR